MKADSKLPVSSLESIEVWHIRGLTEANVSSFVFFFKSAKSLNTRVASSICATFNNLSITVCTTQEDVDEVPLCLCPSDDTSPIIYLKTTEFHRGGLECSQGRWTIVDNKIVFVMGWMGGTKLSDRRQELVPVWDNFLLMLLLTWWWFEFTSIVFNLSLNLHLTFLCLVLTKSPGSLLFKIYCCPARLTVFVPQYEAEAILKQTAYMGIKVCKMFPQNTCICQLL